MDFWDGRIGGLELSRVTIMLVRNGLWCQWGAPQQRGGSTVIVIASHSLVAALTGVRKIHLRSHVHEVDIQLEIRMKV